MNIMKNTVTPILSLTMLLQAIRNSLDKFLKFSNNIRVITMNHSRKGAITTTLGIRRILQNYIRQSHTQLGKRAIKIIFSMRSKSLGHRL